MQQNAEAPPYYPLGILLATTSFITMLLILLPLLWHSRTGNIGATALIAWLLISLLINFTNAIIWPSDNMDTWFNGIGLCDIEVKIQVAAQVGLPASFACILRALATVLDTDRSTVFQTAAQRRRAGGIDLGCCVGFPALQMLLHYVVQTHRYYIQGISGCVPAVADSWLTILLLVVPPAIWVVVDVYFAVLILIRLYRYRLSFSNILASSNTSRSRFLRLYILCLLWIFCSIPVEVYIIYHNANTHWKAYSWSETHNAENWNTLVMMSSLGQVRYDRWIPLAFGILVFIFFGFGREAIKMYRSGLLAIGLGKLFPQLLSEPDSSNRGSRTSFGSKAKALFKRKTTSSTSTWTSGESAVSQTSNAPKLMSPKDKVFVIAIPEVFEYQNEEKGQQKIRQPGGLSDVEKVENGKPSDDSNRGSR